MAVWKVVAAGLFALAISTPAQAECVLMDRFVDAMRPANPSFMIANKEAHRKAIKKLNENRVSNGSYPLEATTLMIAVVKMEDGSYTVAVAMFDKDGCAVKESVVILTIEQWAAFAVSAGISADDFIVFQDS